MSNKEPPSLVSSSSSHQTAMDNSDLQEVADEIKCAVIKDYKKLTLPSEQWMDSGALEISDCYVELELSNCEEKIGIEDIFDTVVVKEGEREKFVTPTVIFVEAPLGNGKTAFSYKLAYDWAINRPYLEKFKLAFLLSLKELKQPIIKEIVSNCQKFTKSENLEKIIEKLAPETLLILDGFDKMDSKSKEHVMSVLYKQVLKNCTVIMTCTTGMLELTTTNKGNHNDYILPDKTLNITGLCEKNQKLVLEKLIDSSNKDQIISCIQKLVDPVKDMFNCPLYLSLLAQNVTDDDGNIVIETRTDLFKCLIDSVVRQSLFKFGDTFPPQEFTLFDASQANSKTVESLYQLGQRSVDQIMMGNKIFKFDGKMEKICKLGLFIICETKENQESVKHYEIFHSSFLEFAVAFSLWLDFKRNNNSFNQEAIDNIHLLFLEKRDDSLVIPFLVGLLDDNACCLFEQLEPYSAIYSSSDCGIGFILEECKNYDKVITLSVNSLYKFFPFVFKSEDIQPLSEPSSAKSNVLKSVLENKQPTTIIISNLETLTKLPHDLKYTRISINLEDSRMQSVEQSQLEQLRCSTLEIFFNNVRLTNNDLLILFSILRLVIADEKIIRFGDKTLLERVLNFVCGNSLQNTPIHELSCYLRNYDSSTVDRQREYSVALEVIRHVVEHNHVRKLSVTTDSDHCLANISTLASNSSYLHTLWLLRNSENEDDIFELDIDRLTRNGAKQWNKLLFDAIKIRTSNDYKFVSKLINYTRCNGTTCNLTGLESLFCTYEFIVDLHRTKTNWNELDALQELSIFFCEVREPVDLAPFRSLISQVKSRNISVKISIMTQFVHFHNDIFECLENSKITEITLVADGFLAAESSEFACLRCLCSRLNRKSFFLESLIIFTDNCYITEGRLISFGLLELLDKGCLGKIFLSMNHFTQINPPINNCSIFSNYNIEHVTTENELMRRILLYECDDVSETINAFSISPR